jgi:hypothetical protein
MEKKGAHNSHAMASEKGANHGFLGIRQSAVSMPIRGWFPDAVSRGVLGRLMTGRSNVAKDRAQLKGSLTN